MDLKQKQVFFTAFSFCVKVSYQGLDRRKPLLATHVVHYHFGHPSENRASKYQSFLGHQNWPFPVSQFACLNPSSPENSMQPNWQTK
jgi:hypothetical protein